MKATKALNLALFAAVILAFAASAPAEVWVTYETRIDKETGTESLVQPDICAPVLKKDPEVKADTIAPGYILEKPSSCEVNFEYVGRDDEGQWIVTVRQSGESEWHVVAGTTVTLRRITPDFFEKLQAGDVIIRPNLYILDLRFTGEVIEKETSTGEVKPLQEMVVLNNYEEPDSPMGAPKPGQTVLVRNADGRFEIEDGILEYDRKWPLKPLHKVDFWVIGVYLVMMIFIGLLVARRNKDAAEYFKGGGHTPWWLAGVSLWMSTFSTITFISGAGMAFERLLHAFASYFTGLGSYILGYFIIAERWRRTRALTTMQYLEERYDNPTHSLFSVVDVIIGVVYAGVQLLSLVAITGAALSLTPQQMPIAILVVGAVIVAYTVLGGFWAVVMTDMLQAVVLVPIALVLAFVCLSGIGGLGPIFQNTPAHFWDFTSKNFNSVILGVGFVTGLFAASSGGAAQRYFAVRDEAAARKVALLTGILVIIGPLIWFVPSMVASWLYHTDQMTMVRLIPNYPIRESVFILMARRILPTGLIGLLLAAMFAATMSSIDTSFNFRGAVLTRDVIRKYLLPRVTDKRLLLLGQIVTLVFGLTAVVLAIVMNKYGKSMFQLIFTVGGKILLPAGIPIVLGLIFKNTKRWTGFACLAVGVALGLAEYVFALLYNAGWISVNIAAMNFMRIEWQIAWIGAVVLVIYFLPGWLSPYKDPEYQARLDAFWQKLHTPVSMEEQLAGEAAGANTFVLTGALTVVIGLLTLALLYFNPNRLIVVTSAITIVFGAAMWIAGILTKARD